MGCSQEAGLGSQVRFAMAGNPNAWGPSMVARALGVGHAIPIFSEDIKQTLEKVDDTALVGQIAKRAPVRTGTSGLGSPVFVGDYNTIIFPLAFAMGIAGVPTETEATFRFTHALRLDDCLLGIYPTIGIDRAIDKPGTSDGTATGHVWAGAKFNGFTLDGALGDYLKLTVPIIARDLADGEDATSWTFLKDVNTGMEYILLSQIQVFLVDAGGDIGAETALADCPTSISMSYEPGMEGDINKAEQPDEPTIRVAPSTRLTLNWSRATQRLRTEIEARFRAETDMHVRVVFTGDVLGAGTFLMTLDFPFTRIDNDPDFTGTDTNIMPLTVELHCQEATTIPTSMTTLKAFGIDIVNNINADPLATS